MEILLLVVLVIIILGGAGYFGYTHYLPRNQIVEEPMQAQEFVIQRPVNQPENITTADGQVFGINPNQNRNDDTIKVTPIVPGDGGRRGF